MNGRDQTRQSLRPQHCIAERAFLRAAVEWRIIQKGAERPTEGGPAVGDMESAQT